MVHVFSDNIGEDRVVITGADVNHLRNVLRMKPGEDILVSDGTGRNLVCSIDSLTEDAVVALILSEEGDRELPVDLVLYQSLPKADKMEWIIQKCTELGVRRIVPVESARCIVRLDDAAAAKKVARWQKIAAGAAEQCQRGQVPEVGPVMRFSEALKDAESLQERVLAYERMEDGETLKRLLSAAERPESIGIFIGPEGGYEAGEVREAENAGVTAITLGRRILRTETAGMALIAAIMLNIEKEEIHDVN